MTAIQAQAKRQTSREAFQFKQVEECRVSARTLCLFSFRDGVPRGLENMWGREAGRGVSGGGWVRQHVSDGGTWEEAGPACWIFPFSLPTTTTHPLTPRPIAVFFDSSIHMRRSRRSTRALKLFTISPMRRTLSNSTWSSSISRRMARKRAISASAICMALPARSYCIWVAVCVC